MKTFAAFLILFSVSQSFAATRLQFFPGNQNAMAIITETSSDGVSDEDWKALMAVMNVPLQNSPMGPGKSIVSQKREFNLICGEARKQCQVFLNKSPNVKIDSAGKKMTFRVTGADALAFREMFLPENAEPMEFVSVDEKFVIQSSVDEFIFTALERSF